jgi:2-(1,2-epoxy-1,2-dihydrophenyl)acetyl-CoA isomerase
VITGAGPAFCSGGDLEMIEPGSNAIRDATEPADTTDTWRWKRRQFGGIVTTIASTDTASVAAVDGPAAGVGHGTRPPASLRPGGRRSPEGAPQKR